MRILLMGVAAIALSGCSFLGLGGSNKANQAYQAYNANTGYAYNANRGAVNPSYSNPSYSNPSYANPSYANPSYANPSYANPANGGYTNNGYAYNANNNGYNLQQAQPIKAKKAKKAKKSCQGQCLARWNYEASLGPEFIVGGQAITGSDTHDIPGVDINNISAADAYDRGWRAELGGSYALSPNRKVSATGFVTTANGNSQEIGTINGETLTGRLSDYQSFGVELGLRQYFHPRPVPLINSIRPYVEGRVGAAYLSGVELENAQLGGAAFGDGGDIDFYDSGFVGTAAGLVGVETPLTRYSTIGLETGVRFTQRPASDNSDILPGSPLSGANNGGARVSVPLLLRGRYRF